LSANYVLLVSLAN